MIEPTASAAEGRLLATTTTVEELDLRFAEARPGLVRLCTSLVGAADADDVVQDVYMIARRQLEQLHDRDALGAWLKRIAVNRCYDQHRRA